MPRYQKLAITQQNSPRLTIVDGATFATSSPATIPTGDAAAVAYSHDHALVAVAHASIPRVSIYNTDGLTKLANPSVQPANSGTGIAFSPNDALLAVSHGTSPFVTIYNTVDWSKVADPTDLPAGAGNDVAFSPDGSLMAVAHNTSPYVTIYNTSNWSKVANPTDLPAGTGNGVAFSPDGSRLVVAHNTSPFVTIYNTSTWSKVANPAVLLPFNGRKCAFSPDGSKLLASHYPRSDPADQGYIVYNTADWSAITGLPQIPAYYGIGVAWADNTFFAVAWAATPYGYLIDVGTKLTVEQFDSYISAPARGLAFIRLAGPGPEPGENIDTPIEITVTSAAQTIDTPVRVQVGTAENIDTSTRITVVAASVLAGLNGAGGWAAAPDGKWRAVVHLAGVDISALLTDGVRVTMADDEASTAQFSFRPGTALAPMDLIRRQVRITFAPASGLNAQLMFTGVVDVPEIDVRTGVIECRCTDQLQEIIANTPREWIDANVGGRWSEAVSGSPVDTWDYLEARIKSVPKSIALDRLQRPVVLPWRDLPRSITIKGNDHVHGTVSVELPSSAQIRTRVTARLQYRYTRLRARGAVAAWAQPFEFFAAYDNVTGLRLRQWLMSAMVESATERLPAWERVGQVRIEHPEAGVYFPNPPNFLGYSIGVETAPALASSFTAKYRTRWTQTITESYAITLRLADLEASIGGPVSEEFGANLVAGPAPERWTSDYTTLPNVAAPSVGDATQAWYTDGADEAARDEALRTLHDQAWVRLWSASRSGRVSLTLPCRPDLWLDVWATVERDGVHAAGKVTALTHAMNVQSGEAITSLSIAVGMPGNTPAAMPAPTLPELPAEDTDRPLSAYSVEIGTYVGGESGSPAFDAETMIGYITNTRLRGVVGEELYHRYPHQLSMRAPSIDEIDRDPLTLDASITIDTDIPTDLLETS